VRHHFPFLIFCVVSILITFQAVVKRWSLIPVLGLLTNLYLMSELGVTNWFRFGIWLVIGLLLYFTYGSRHSRIKENVSKA
ncbi:MAG: amino acid permease C-terminal domain-containing protein, partial [Bacteroidia bacterium]